MHKSILKELKNIKTALNNLNDNYLDSLMEKIRSKHLQFEIQDKIIDSLNTTSDNIDIIIDEIESGEYD